MERWAYIHFHALSKSIYEQHRGVTALHEEVFIDNLSFGLSHIYFYTPVSHTILGVVLMEDSSI